MPYVDLEAKLRQVAYATGSTFSLVAYDEQGLVGTASVIPSDMDERPQYSPWVAALWVEKRARGCGIDSRLVQEAMSQACIRGAKTLHLCARPALIPFYTRLGWSIIEHGVGNDGLTIFNVSASTASA